MTSETKTRRRGVFQKVIDFVDHAQWKLMGHEAFYNQDGLIKGLAALFDEAEGEEENIRVVGTELLVFEDERVTGSLERAAGRGVNIELIGDQEPDLGSKLWRLIFQRKVDYYQHDALKRPHFAVVNDKVMKEYPNLHDPHDDVRHGYISSSQSDALYAIKEFTRIKNEASPLFY